MVIKNNAVCGTMESNDVFVAVAPGENGVELSIDSIVKSRFGRQIEATAREMLQKFEVENAVVQLRDFGAVDCVIRARMEAALRRAGGAES